jgi:soluble lytic murein transglycosylase
LGASCPAPPAGSDSAWTELQSGPAVLGESAAPALRRAAILARWGLQDEAEAELGAVRRELARDPPALRALALAADSIGVSRGAMSAVAQLRARLGGSILFQSMPATAARLLYPLVQVEHVLRWCDEYGVDPFFVFAVMREESWLDPEAVSRAGARGLLQIMPATGEDLARQTGLEEFERGDLFDPAINIRLGVFYLRRLLDRFDNEPLLVLAAYNAGEKNALRWRADAEGKLDADRTAAEITYTETFDYVQKVLTTREIYRSLYAESLPRLRGMLANSAAVD